MSKKLLLLFIAIFAVFGLASCESEVELTAITFSGVADISVDNGSTFNVLDGVVALGNDEVDYSDQITLVTTSSAVNTTTGALDTLQAGVHFVRYEVRVGELVAQQSRNITVKAPVAVEGELVVNGDMSSGIGGWNDAEVVYVADGATMTLTAEDGALKAEVVAGSNFYTPRFGQMNMAFETGKTYEVSFDAKSSVAKEIALQVGEIVGVAFGYYNDYLRKPEDILYRTITTEWTTFSYKFTVQNDQVLDIDGDGETGGIIFGLGKIGENSVNATMYFDNIVIEESTPDEDMTGPAISGAVDVEIKIGSTFNPLTGVQALDVTDGDVTANLVAVIKDVDGDIVSAVDTSAPGIFTVTYTVSDSLNNKSELVITVNVVDEIPEPEWIGYGVSVRAKAIVQYSGTTDAWWNNNAQLPLDEFDGSKTTATFDFVGVKDQEYVFKIEGGGKFVETAFTATGDMQQAVLDLAGLTEAERNGLTLAVVFAKTLNGAGTLHLYTVLEAEVTSDWLFYGMTGQNVTTMEYPAPDLNAWWNNNAQLSILEFDGTKDTVLFNFVGAAGVKYMFKIEGGGKFVEVPVVATGELQEHSLSLSGLTEAEREGLNLLIIFNMDATAVTSLDLYSVEYVIKTEPEWIGYGVSVRAKAIVQYSGTTDAWWNNNAQLPLDEFDGSKTTATFDFVGVKDQEYVFKIEGGGKFVETAFTATGDMQQAVLDLAGLTEAERNGLTLAVVFAKTLNGAGTLHLYTVLEAEVTSDWLFYGMTGQNVTTMEYPAPDLNAWWNNNAQLSILEFDGTKDTVLFNFVGAAGVKYMFKIEGGGKFVEVPVVATGELQEHSLSLSGLTEAEREGLNLLIIFNMDATAVTSLDLYSVEYVTTVNYANSTVFTKSGFTTSYADGTFTDTNGLVWTFVHARDAGDFGFGENQDGIMLRRADEPSSLQVTLTSGLDDLSIEFKKAFTGGTPRTYEIHITNNGSTEIYIIPAFGEGTGANDTVGTFTLSNLGLTGDVIVKIVAVGSNGNQQAVFNNFKWNANPTT